MDLIRNTGCSGREATAGVGTDLIIRRRTQRFQKANRNGGDSASHDQLAAAGKATFSASGEVGSRSAIAGAFTGLECNCRAQVPVVN